MRGNNNILPESQETVREFWVSQGKSEKFISENKEYVLYGKYKIVVPTHLVLK